MNEIIKQRNEAFERLAKVQDQLTKIEYQISLMPFYVEMTELKQELISLNKTISSCEKQIFESMVESNTDKYSLDWTICVIEESTKPSLEIYNKDLLPPECFVQSLDTKTNIWKIIKKYKEEWKELEWARFTYSKSLKII